MKDISNSIYQYYVDRFDELPFDKQLHFASRLYLWSGDAFAKMQLERLRPVVTAHDNPAMALRAVHEEARKTISHGSKNAAALRDPYFQKYPEIRPLAMVLFRLTFLESLYGLDARATFFELFDRAEVESLFDRILADPQALAILSTHAINVLYLYHRAVRGNDTSLDPAPFLTVGRTAYDFSDPIQLQLYIYLYTHCIIGESRFYARKLPERYLPVYRQMIAELEDSIADYFGDINLDNKFEFLTCCKLVGVESALREHIEAEAADSLSPDGTFLVDRHNNNPQTANSTLALSEHRNVLYILSHRTFVPSKPL